MPRCTHRAAVVFAPLLAFLAVITPAAARQDQPAAQPAAQPTSKPAADQPAEKPLTNRPVVLIQTTNSDDSHSSIIGVFIAPGEVLIGAAAIDEARSATAILPTCEKFEVEGILAIDETADLAILKVSTPGFTPTIAPIGELLPQTGAFVIADVVIRMQGCWGMLAHTKPLPILSTRTWAGLGERIRLAMPGGNLATWGCPIYDVANNLCGLVCYGAGNKKSFAIPVTKSRLPARGGRGGGGSELIPLAKHAERPATDRMKASRLARQVPQLFEEKKHEEALPLTEQVLKVFPDDWQALYERGVCLDVTGKPTEALADLRRSTEIEPGYSESWYSLGLVMVKGGNDRDAIDAFQHAIAVDPDYSKAHGMLAVALYRDGQLDSAVTEANESIRLDPDNRGHYQNLAIFFEESKRPADVADVWKRYRDANPGDGIGWSQLAESYRKLDKDPEAITAYKKAAELRPDNLHVQLELAVALAQAGQWPEAQAAADQALKIDPTSELALKIKSFIEREKAKPKQ